MAAPEEHREPPRTETTTWEWAVAAVSTLLVLGTVGLLLYEGIAGTSTPPAIEISVERIEAAAGGYVVTFWAANRGQTTAASLTVEGILKSGQATVEASTVTLSYVPAEARRQAGLFFTYDPRAYAMEIRPMGYDRP